MSSKFQRRIRSRHGSFEDTSPQVSFPRAQSPVGSVLLEGATSTISSIVDIPEYRLVAVASHDNSVRVYSLETSAAPRVVFRQHIDQVRGVAHLCSDVMVSVADDRTVMTWGVTDGAPIDSAHLENWALSVARIDDTRFVVGTTEGELVIFSHENGHNLKQVRYLFKAITDWVFQIAVHDNVAVSCSHNKVVALWNTRNWKRICVLQHDEWVKCVAVSERFIVAGCYNGKLFVYRNAAKFTLSTTLHTNSRIQSMQFVDPNTLVICGVSGTVSIVSVADEHGIAEIIVKVPKTLWAMQVAHTGQILVGGKDGTTSLVSLPPQIERMLQNDNVSVDCIDPDEQYETNAVDGSNEDDGSTLVGSAVTSEHLSEATSTRNVETHGDSAQYVPETQSQYRGACCIHVELDRWKSMRFNCRTIGSLSAEECARFIAAFLIKFDLRRSENFNRIKEYLVASFEHNFVDGDVLVGLSRKGKRRQAKKLRVKILAAVMESEGVGKRLGLEYRLDLLLERLRKLEPAGQGSGCIPLFGCFLNSAKAKRWR